jgi:hypothetical protein
MLTRTKLALVGALVLGLGTVAQAGGSKDDDPQGGFRVGPMWQSFPGANPAYHPSMRGRIYARGMTWGGEAYGFVPRRPIYCDRYGCG